MPAVSFRPTAADLIGGYRVLYGVQLRAPRMRRAAIAGGVLCALLAQIAVWGDGWRPALIAAAIGFAYWVVLLSLILGVAWLLLPRRVRRIHAQQKALHDDVHVEWSPTGIETSSSRGVGRLAWTDFIRIAENRAAIILMQSDALFNFIPKRVLSSAEAADLVTVARAAMAPA